MNITVTVKHVNMTVLVYSLFRPYRQFYAFSIASHTIYFGTNKNAPAVKWRDSGGKLVGFNNPFRFCCYCCSQDESIPTLFWSRGIHRRQIGARVFLPNQRRHNPHPLRDKTPRRGL